MLWYWDEITCETREVTDANPLYCWIAEHRELGIGWEQQYVADFPGGVRIVIETDQRAHTAILMTKL